MIKYHNTHETKQFNFVSHSFYKGNPQTLNFITYSTLHRHRLTTNIFSSHFIITIPIVPCKDPQPKYNQNNMEDLYIYLKNEVVKIKNKHTTHENKRAEEA